MERPLKLFVWTDFCPDWTGGLAFAIAKTEKGARRLIQEERSPAYARDPKKHPYGKISEWGDLEVYPLTGPIARCVSGGS